MTSIVKNGLIHTPTRKAINLLKIRILSITIMYPHIIVTLKKKIIHSTFAFLKNNPYIYAVSETSESFNRPNGAFQILLKTPIC